MPLLVILAVGRDPTILTTRSSILRDAGYVVKEAVSVAEAIHLFEYGDFDLVLLCHSLLLSERDELTRVIQSSGSRIPIYSVAPVSLSRTFSRGRADGTLSSLPEKLKKELEDVLRITGANQAGAKWDRVESFKHNS